MKPVPILLFILLTNGLYSQSSHKKDKEVTKFIATFSGGLNFSKASDNMMAAMIDADLGDDVQIGHSLYSYPTSERKLGAYDASLQYRINEHTGLLVGGGLVERFETRGNNGFSDAARLWLETKVHQVRCQYVFLGESRWSFSIGPSLTFVYTQDNYPASLQGTYQMTSQTTNFGISGTGDFHFIEAKNFFFSLSSQINWVAPVTIGPFYGHRSHEPGDPNNPLKYQPEDIHFSSVAIMLGFGLKL